MFIHPKTGPIFAPLCMCHIGKLYYILMVFSSDCTYWCSLLCSTKVLQTFIQVIYLYTKIKDLLKDLCFRELQRLESMSRSPIFTLFSDTCRGAQTIRIYSKSKDFSRLMFYKLDENTNSHLLLDTSARWLGVALVCT